MIAMAIVELNNFTLPPSGKGLGLSSASFRLREGDICAVSSQLPDDCHLFIRALATLERPTAGDYLFRGEKLDYSSYVKLLPYKKKISLISPESVLISNRSLRENLLFGRMYFENRSDLELDPLTADLCRAFRIDGKLEMRPATLDEEEIRTAVIIRELAKLPELILLARPHNHLGDRNFRVFMDALKPLLDARVPVVVLSSDEAFLREFSNRNIKIMNGTVGGPD